MKKKDAVLALLVVIIWGANFTVIKLGLDGVPSMLLGSLRYLVAALPAVFFIKKPNLEWKYIILYGLTVGVGQFACLFYAMEIGMPPGLASIVAQVQPFISSILGWVILKEKLTIRQIVGFFIAAGGLVIIGSASTSIGINSVPLAAILLTILGSAFWASSNIVVRFVSNRALAKDEELEMFNLVVWGGLVPPIPLLLFALLLYGPEVIVNSMMNLTGISIFSALYLGLGSTLFCYGVWSQLIAKYSIGKITPLSLLVPITGLLTARIILSEKLTMMQWIGVIVILTGLIVADFDFEPVKNFFRGYKGEELEKQ